MLFTFFVLSSRHVDQVHTARLCANSQAQPAAAICCPNDLKRVQHGAQLRRVHHRTAGIVPRLDTAVAPHTDEQMATAAAAVDKLQRDNL